MTQLYVLYNKLTSNIMKWVTSKRMEKHTLHTMQRVIKRNLEWLYQNKIKVDFTAKKMTRDKKEQYILIKR